MIVYINILINNHKYTYYDKFYEIIIERKQTYQNLINYVIQFIEIFHKKSNINKKIDKTNKELNKINKKINKKMNKINEKLNKNKTLFEIFFATKNSDNNLKKT